MRGAGLLAAAVLALGAPVQSSGKIGNSEERAGMIQMHALAECTVKRHRDSAVRMLSFLPLSPDSVRIFLATDPSSCMEDEGELHMKDHFLRGALAERLLRQDFSAIGTFVGKKLPPIFAWPDREAFAALKPETKLNLTMIHVGECAAEAAPDRVYSLFATPVASPAEEAAIRSLVPVLRTCVFQGDSVELKLATIRAYIGEGAYRVSVQRASARGQAR